MAKSKILFRPLSYFYYGSLGVIMFALVVGAFFLAGSFIQNEQKRAKISALQVEHSIGAEYRYIVEEFFTNSYDSIFIRVANSLKKFGSPAFEIYLYNINGQCLIARNNDDSEIPCKNQIQADKGQFFYKAEIKLGSTRLGEMKVIVEDRFQFFTGTAFDYTIKHLLPVLLLVPLLWLIWAFLSRKFILEPFYKQMLDLEKERISTDIIRQIIHDTKGEIASLDLQICQLENDPIAKEMKETLNHIREAFSNLGHHKEGIVTTVREIPLNAAHVFKDFIEQMKIKYKMHSPRVVIDSHISEGFQHKIKVDSNAFYRVLSNLVENSVTAPNDEREILIKLSIFEEDNAIRIFIEDNANGIPNEVRDRIFEKGFTTKESGSGQGLFFVKNTLNGWKGSIAFRTKHNDSRGTKFELTLPAYTKPKVVILEDASKLLYRYKKIIERFGHQTETFEDVPSLLSRSKFFDDDTIFLLDFNLSEKSNGAEAGIELANMGMKNIYFHTGNPSLVREDFPYVKGILSKGNFMETIAQIGIG
jgi:signal transduction histidine kinase